MAIDEDIVTFKIMRCLRSSFDLTATYLSTHLILTIIHFHLSTPATPMLSTQASDETRQARGWKFTANVDDADSECALDNRDWDFVIENNGASIDGSLAQLMAMIAAA